MSDYRNDPPTIIEHTTVNPVVERTTTIIERDAWYSEPWMIALFIGAIAVIGLISYWAFYNPNQPAPVVTNTTIERDVPDHRAQTLASPSVTPPVVVNPPATSSSPTININPAPTSSSNSSNPSPSRSTTSDSDNYPNGAATPGDGSGNNGVANGTATSSGGSGDNATSTGD